MRCIFLNAGTQSRTSFVIAYNLDGRVRNKKKVILDKKYIYLLKGLLLRNYISSDPPCKNGNVQLILVPLKPLSEQYCKR